MTESHADAAAEASTNPVAAFVVASSYATIDYEECATIFDGDGGSDASGDGGTDGGCSGQSLSVVLTNNAKLTCGANASGANYLDVPSTNSLILNVATAGGTDRLTPGTYTLGSTVNATILAHADFLSSDSTCTIDDPISATTGGSVTVTTISTTSATGSYDVKLATGGSLTGKFNVSKCASATDPAALGQLLDAGACKSL